MTGGAEALPTSTTSSRLVAMLMLLAISAPAKDKGGSRICEATTPQG